jgi:hypothetical protein
MGKATGGNWRRDVDGGFPAFPFVSLSVCFIVAANSVPNSVNEGFKDVTEVEIFVNRISREAISQLCLESRAAAGALGEESWEK